MKKTSFIYNITDKGTAAATATATATATAAAAAMDAGSVKTLTCWPDEADVGMPTNASDCTMGGGRSYPELLYAGVLTAEQVDAIYVAQATSNNPKYGARPMTLGCAGYNSKQVTYWGYGLPYGLLQV
jgi:hypothetical protein